MLTIEHKQKLSESYQNGAFNVQYKTEEEFLRACEEDATTYNLTKEQIEKLIEQNA